MPKVEIEDAELAKLRADADKGAKAILAAEELKAQLKAATEKAVAEKAASEKALAAQRAHLEEGFALDKAGITSERHRSLVQMDYAEHVKEAGDKAKPIAEWLKGHSENLDKAPEYTALVLRATGAGAAPDKNAPAGGATGQLQVRAPQVPAGMAAGGAAAGTAPAAGSAGIGLDQVNQMVAKGGLPALIQHFKTQTQVQ